MKFNTLILTSIAVLTLAACNQKVETSVPASDVTPATSTSDTATTDTALQTLTSRDNKINILVQGGQFEDISTQQDNIPTDAIPDEFTLLQKDNQRDITLYVTNFGAPKTDAKTYFNNLKNVINNDKSLKDTQIGIATTNRMNYRFTQADQDGDELRENCIAIYEANIYSVCANSHTASQEDLSAVLKDVNLVK